MSKKRVAAFILAVSMVLGNTGTAAAAGQTAVESKEETCAIEGDEAGQEGISEYAVLSTPDESEDSSEADSGSEEMIQETGIGGPEETVQEADSSSVSENNILLTEEAQAEAERWLAGEEAESLVEVTVNMAEGTYQAGGFQVVDSLQPQLPGVYLRTYLSAYSDREIEEYLYNGIKNREEKIYISQFGLISSNIKYYVYGVINDHPELYFANTYFTYTMDQTGLIHYIRVAYLTGDDAEAFDQAVAEAMALVDEEMSDFEKALIFHEYIVLNTAYDYENYLKNTLPAETFTAYGVFVDKVAVCQGYALAYKLLCDKAGIECYMVTSSSMNHAWNIVKLGNYYYQLDATWNDPVWDAPGRVSHNYLFSSDSSFERYKGHYGGVVTSGSKVITLKAADTTYDNYFWGSTRSPLVIKDGICYYIDYASREAIIGRNLQNGEESIIFSEFSSYGWYSAYSTLFMVEDQLYFNLAHKIMGMNPDGTGLYEASRIQDAGESEIYSCLYADDKVYYLLLPHSGYLHSQANELLSTSILLKAPITSVSLATDTLEITEGESISLEVQWQPQGAIAKEISFSGGKEGIATIDDEGKITAYREGEASFTVAVTDYYDTTVRTECKVTVVPPRYTVSFLGMEGGKPLEEPQQVLARRAAVPPQNITPLRGYEHTGNWLGGDYSYIEGDSTFIAEYRPVQYTITYQSGSEVIATNNASGYTIETAVRLEKPTGEAPGENMVFAGWYDNAGLTGNPVEMIEPGTTGDIILYAAWKSEKGLWFQEVFADDSLSGDINQLAPKEYTGSAIKPQLKVYYGDKELAEGKDYSIRFRNNTAVGQAEMILQGKGSYAGTLKESFSITPKNLGDTDVWIEDVAAAYNRGRSIKPVPEVLWGTKKLYNRRDFELSYTSDGEGAYRSPGTYVILIRGKGNYTGEVEVQFTIVDEDRILLNRAKISGSLQAEYTGKAIQAENFFSLLYGNEELRVGEDYRIRVMGDREIKEIGTYQLFLEALEGGSCAGSRRISFTITGRNMIKAVVEPLGDRTYTGNVISFLADAEEGNEERLAVSYTDPESGEPVPLIYGTDYEFTCTSVNVGLGRVTITGKGLYYGTLTKTFRILPPASDEEEEEMASQGAAGSEQSIQLTDMQVRTPDLVVSAVPGSYRSTPVVTDGEGRRLVEGADYRITGYYDGNGTALSLTDMPVAGTEITVKLSGMGSYSGEAVATFRIVERGRLLSGATVEVNKQISYSGGKVTLSKADLTVIMGNTLLSDEDYRIRSLRNNAERGNAVIVLEGTGRYAGTRQVSIQIAAEEIVLGE
ncbi:MAG: InlB B-repeat-containing protein [Lachnospiraceae bacterium]|nr:InlB B-repeat-containing protein [Lachnospiraceae bacterium]